MRGSHRHARAPTRLAIGTIARDHAAAVRETVPMSANEDAVLRALERCRTPALGGHVEVCDACGHREPRFHSCRNRHCPTCQAIAQHRWLEQRRERLLEAPYFHCVFTVPEPLRVLFRTHPRVLLDALFEAVRRTLLAFANDPKHLGATPAITAVLHTWTRELVFHPHVHAIVSAGGWRDHEQRWIPSSGRYLFPVKAMAKVFRGTMREFVLHAVERGAVCLEPADEARIRRALFETRWVVYAKPPFGGVHDVFAYLGRYTHRVGISNARLLAYDRRTVTFATKFGRSTTLESVEFLARFLRHTLPTGFHKIRHFGLASSSHVRLGTLDRARVALATGLVAPATVERVPRSDTEILLALTGIDLRACARCGAPALRAAPLDEPEPTSTTRIDSS